MSLTLEQTPTMWAHRRKRDGFIRTASKSKPSKTLQMFADMDGDEIVPLFTAQQVAEAIAHERARCVEACRSVARMNTADFPTANLCARKIEAPADGGQPGE